MKDNQTLNPANSNSNALIADTNDLFWAAAIALWAAFCGGGSNYLSGELSNISRQVTLGDFLTREEKQGFQMNFETQTNAVELLKYMETEASRTADPAKRYQVRLMREDIADRYEAMASVLDRAYPTLSAKNPKAAKLSKEISDAMKAEAKQIRSDPNYIPREIIHPSRSTTVSSNSESIRSKILEKGDLMKTTFGLNVSNPIDMAAAEYLYRRINNEDTTNFFLGVKQSEKDAVLKRVGEASNYAKISLDSSTPGTRQTTQR
jgi:hypothetical protein